MQRGHSEPLRRPSHIWAAGSARPHCAVNSPAALPGVPSPQPPLGGATRGPRGAEPPVTARGSAALPGRAPSQARPARRPCQRGAAGRTGPYPSPRERHAPPGASATSPPVPRAPQPRPCCTPAPSDLRPTATLPGTSPPDPAAAPRAAAAAANHGRRTAKRGPWRRRLLPVTARLRPPLDDGRAVPAAGC